MDNNEELPSFENYQVLRELGRGGMGVVYLAEDKRLNRQVALKVIHAAKIHSISKDQIINEAKILANLNHANIVHLYDIVEEHDSIALVMEYVDGIDLKRAIVEQYASLEQKIIWLRQIAQALEYAHDHNILHRDIKPENILVSNSNIAKLSDFGISEVISGTHTRSFKEHSQNKSEKFSSLLTLAPEEINGASVDTKSDLFSLGCVCYTLLCGKHPFVTGSVINKNEIIKNILHNEPINPKDFNPNIPAEICTLVVSLLQKDKSKRPPNAADVVGRLVAHEKNPSGLNDVDLTETLPTSELYKAPTRFPAWLKGTLAMLVVVVCCVAGYWIYDSRPIEKKYVAIYEPALWDSEGVSDIEKDLYLSASVWIREYLLAHPNVSVLETSVAEKPGISIEDFFKQTAADEVVVPKLSCRDVVCNLSTRIVEKKSLSVIEEVNNKFIYDDINTMLTLIENFLSNFYSNSNVYFQNLKSISNEDFYQYLALYRGQIDGSISSSELIAKIDTFHQANPRFPGLYKLWIKTLLHEYYNSGDQNYLRSVKGVIDLEDSNFPSSSQAFFHRLHYLLNTKKYDLALEIIESKSNLGLEEELQAYAIYYTYTANYSLARDYYLQLIKVRPNVDNYYNFSLNLWWESKYKQLDKSLEKLLSLDPDHFLGKKLLAASKLSQGELIISESIYLDILKYRDDVEVRNNLGLVYMLKHQYSEAENQFDKALQVNSNEINAILNVSEARLLQNKLDLANEGFLKIISLTEGQDIDIFNSKIRALAYVHLGEYSEAVNLIRQLEILYPDNAEVLYSSAIIYSVVGDAFSACNRSNLAIDNGLGAVWLLLPWLSNICEVNSGSVSQN
ncbi:serine/threonine-protein kinase [Sessilibacter corallicola]|uniref:serine/threonine-protein kinase n=1 Tax=Sessilibacter corallicola TaxID=2904075 RepID=UPI001E3A1713|nr:serine/threonine-protein kinase [Sessilibacter corallicola]MCE2027420.1 protein kinase [Sessilibacter corallicola]